MLNLTHSTQLVANDVTGSTHTPSTAHRNPLSWIHLIAEMQGVPQVSLIRANFRGVSSGRGHLKNLPLRILFQVEDQYGQVLGSAIWEGDSSQLEKGASIDLGYSLCQLEEPLSEEQLTMSAQLLDQSSSQPASRLDLKALRQHELLVPMNFADPDAFSADSPLRRAPAASNQQW